MFSKESQPVYNASLKQPLPTTPRKNKLVVQIAQIVTLNIRERNRWNSAYRGRYVIEEQ